MSRKVKPGRKPSKKTGPAKNPAKPKPPELQEPRLTLAEVKQIDLFEARRETQNTVLENLLLRENILAMKHRQEMVELQGRQKGTKNSIKQIALEHRAFVQEIEARLGIKLADYTLQDDGLLTYNPIEENSGEEKEE